MREGDVFAKNEHEIIAVLRRAYRVAGRVVFVQAERRYRQRRVPVDIAGNGDACRAVGQRAGDIGGFGIACLRPRDDNGVGLRVAVLSRDDNRDGIAARVKSG